MSEEKPCVRPLEVVPVQSGNQLVFVVRDPEGLSEEALVIGPLAFYLMALMDGSRSVLDIQVEFARRFGTILPSEKIDELIDQLDKHHLLENTNYHNWRRTVIEEFRRATVREAYHAGNAYPADPDEARKMVVSMIESSEVDWEGRPLAVVAPHIDLRRGGGCFGAAYKILRNISSKETTFVLLGTSHAPMEQPFCLTKKDFRTPLGLAKNNQEFAASLLERLPWLADDEFRHRGEHSVEFQVLFLQQIFGEDGFSILPILCASFHPFMEKNQNPEDEKRISDFLEAMGEVVLGSGRVVLIAGADLSHIGRRFGDGVSMVPEVLDWLRGQDEEMLSLIVKGDADGLFLRIAKERDARRICGLPPIWTLLKLLPKNAQGKVLKYEQSVEKETESVVTFAAVAWRSDDGGADSD